MSDDEDLLEMERMRTAAKGRPLENPFTGSKSFSWGALGEKHKRLQAMEEQTRAYFGSEKKHEEGRMVGPAKPQVQDSESDEHDEDDAKEPSNVDSNLLVDEGDIYKGWRENFPLSFGKQESRAAPLEAIHSKTKRSAVVSHKDGSILTSTKGKVQACQLQEESSGHAVPMQEAEDNIMIGPPKPMDAPYSDIDSDEEAQGIGDEGEDQFQVPLSNEIVFKGPTKVVSSLAVDPTGSRVLTGSYDYNVHMYDFQGMDARLRSFRQLEPSEGHQVRCLSWSPTADQFIAITGSAQAKVYNRDGFTLGEFAKGDMYIRDLKNTKGHISGLTAGQWHPRDKEKALTASEDGSLRIWDVTDFKSQKQVIKPKLQRPGRVAVTACSWGLDGKCMVGGLADGSVQVWNVKAGWGSKPDIHIEKAHESGNDVTGLCFSADGFTLLSRSTDCTLKVWDLRKSKNALKEFTGLPNSYSQTNASFSPDERLIFTGTSTEKGSKAGGLLVFFSKEHLELVRKVGISSSLSVVISYWHPRLNQIFATAGDKKEGGTHVLYDPALSERGALVCMARAPRKKSVEDFEVRPVVHNPHALPLFRNEPSRKRQREKARSDPMKSKRPDLPVTGPGFGGRVGTTKGSLLTQYLLKEGGLIKETWMDEDPREAILKHAEAAAKDPKYIVPAYSHTQPKTIFAESESEEEK